MKILSPINSLKSLNLQIKAGVDEIYVGLDMFDTVNVSFSGRAIRGNGGSQICVKENELKDIVNLAHDNNVKVNYAANIISSYSDSSNFFKSTYLNYIEKGINAGVDACIIADIGNIISYQEAGFDRPIHASTFFKTYNGYQVEFLRKLGVKRIVLPYQIKLDEIETISSLYDDLEFEVFGHLGCSNINASCRLIHNIANTKNLGIVCRNNFVVSDESGTSVNESFLDMGLDCSICTLSKLLKMNICTLKIVGRDVEGTFTAGLTKIYRESIDRLISQEENFNPKNIAQKNKVFKEFFCNNGRCKYLEGNKVIEHYI